MGLNENGTGCPWETNAILPTDVRPETYDLSLDPDIQNGTFQGRVKITLNVTQKRDHIILHSKLLSITKVMVVHSASKKNIPVKSSFEYEPNEFWVTIFEKELTAGRYLMSMEFTGSLKDKIVGFYRSRYLAPDNSTRYIVSTKFEPTYARMSFPCFDEPSYKAVFNIELVKPTEGGYNALSNMNQVKEIPNSPAEGKTTVKFAPTPPMSTYLACFIVCDFEQLPPGITKSGTAINVFAREGQLRHMLYTRDLAVYAMDFYTDYFNMKYPLPKLDLIAIPDFVSGAMENWGLVTFRETSVLISDGTSSFLDHWRVASTVCHELAHMWFGNTVTMNWWDDLWLNEGFATFMAVKCGAKIKSQLYFEVMALSYSVHPVLIDDAVLSSHPIIQKVDHPDQITEIFDSISYNKGSSVLKMLEDLSPSSFREALTMYLKRYEYGNAKTEDLWSCIEEVMDSYDISRVMGTWTRQAGYPLVNITRRGNTLVLTQQRFLASKGTPFDPSTSPYGYKWDIPIVYLTSKDPRKIDNIMFEMDKEKVYVNLPEGVTWFKMNWRQVGFYRVNYPPETWKDLTELLKENHTVLSWVEDRANLLDDAFSLARSGYISYGVPLSLISYLKNNVENHFLPWSVVSRHLSFLRRSLVNTSAKDIYLDFARNIVESCISDSTWEITNKTPHNEMLTKLEIVKVACSLELPSAINKARSLLQDWLDGNSDKPHAELRSVVYKYGITGDKESSKWERLWQIYLVERSPLELSKLREALTFAREPATLNRLLDLSKNDTYVRSQDYLLLLMKMSYHPTGNDVVWDFVRNEWEYLVERFTLNDRVLGRLVPTIVTDFNSHEKLNEVKSFFTKWPEAGAGASKRKTAIETIENNIKWAEKHVNEISSWIRDPNK